MKSIPNLERPTQRTAILPWMAIAIDSVRGRLVHRKPFQLAGHLVFERMLAVYVPLTGFDGLCAICAHLEAKTDQI
jgi:hypothetical protein